MGTYCLRCKKKKLLVFDEQTQITDYIKLYNFLEEKSRFMKNQEASPLFNNLGIRTPLSKIPLAGDILF